MNTLENLSKEDKKTIIIITHDKTLYKENYNLINIEKWIKKISLKYMKWI